MTPPAPAAWLPGLPPEPCVCDLAIIAAGWPGTVRSEYAAYAFDPATWERVRPRPTQAHAGLSVTDGMRYSYEWRPILVPDGVPAEA